jgi:hypothetical protein
MGGALTKYFGGEIVSKADDVGFVAPAAKGNRVPSTAKAQVEKLLDIPSRWSAQQVVQEAREAGQADIGTWLLKKGLTYRKQRIQAGMEAYDSAAEFAMFGMRMAEKAGHTDNRFARELAKHGVSMAAEVAQVQGYEAALKSFETHMG